MRRSFVTRCLIPVGVVISIAAASVGTLFDRASSDGSQAEGIPSPEAGSSLFCAPGLTEPASRVVELRAARPGRLIEIRVEAGGEVARGDVLAVLDHGDLDAAVLMREGELAASRARLALLLAGSRAEEIEAARARLATLAAAEDAAQARLAEAEAGPRIEEIAAARAHLTEATFRREDAARTVERNRPLVESGAMEQAILDEARTALDVASAQVEAASAQLAVLEAGTRPERIDESRADVAAAKARAEEAAAALAQLVRGPREEEKAEARAEVEAAEARLAAAHAELEDAFVRSPLAGVVVYRHACVGEQVTPADERPILEVGSARPLHVRADVDEFDLARVRVGMKVHATAPAFGERRFAGKVMWIEKALGRKNFRSEYATERKDSKVLEVVVALEEGAEGVLPVGFPVRVWFEETAGE
ncbi:MAG: efflux RND transporter periplasmic adaptor subunit [Planctomycetes bacterium]|nr:efflux RND transporter periplasmic adaptor subunit [Planctomycetota bacterium]